VEVVEVKIKMEDEVEI